MTITYTYPDGRVITTTRPGHSVAGLLYYLDPFNVPYAIPLRRVAVWLQRTCD